ncbi:hypothetical protein XO47_15190 [Listeria monocytogenes]|nr:hypothetical protein [Listeria monocytogenes]
MELQDIKIEREHLKSIIKNQDYNGIIQDHYFKLQKETKDEKLTNKIEKLSDCNAVWILDRYDKAKIKDFKKTNLCNDKFCNNCKKVKQAARMGKFIPLLEPYAKDMYQLTLTIPNVKGQDLKVAIGKIFKSFAKLIEYMKGKEKITGIDFESMQYEGAIRSLEVTYKGNEYHPHLHALIVLKGKTSAPRHKNTYSIDFKGQRSERLFNDEEITIQKIWYLLMNGKRVTKKAIDELKKGYSCTLDKFRPDDFIELFKYMTKATTEDAETLKYRQFKTLYYALYRVRQIQGYGCFYGLKDDDEITMDEVNAVYNGWIDELRQKENPIQTFESPTELSNDTEYTLISRKKAYSYLKNQLKN